MSLVLVWLASGASALPLSPTEVTGIFDYECSDISSCRTIFGIVWSCLATIFACTWVAVHPNVPAPEPKYSLQPVVHRVAITVCALLVPEYIVAWSIRQWLVASHVISDIRSDIREAEKRKMAHKEEQAAEAERSVRDTGVFVSRQDPNTQYRASEGVTPVQEADKERDTEVEPRGLALITNVLASVFALKHKHG
ncbi:hypothetical protein FIBSPDRAFT_938473 [Athelia psychrophila]|uniref:Uncharacterized protein n=1 Tax=Athelia psychrophila TaxID=1759441 RepID=A0A165YEI9_9AGAM|nr:hypothetical protein FIBSPDRAFT_938473 [Fibularhizoctonia sp. CBS 109695]